MHEAAGPAGLNHSEIDAVTGATPVDNRCLTHRIAKSIIVRRYQGKQAVWMGVHTCAEAKEKDVECTMYRHMAVRR